MKLQALLQRFLKKKEAELVQIAADVSSAVNEEALLIKQRIESKKRKQKKLKIAFGTLISLVVVLGAFAGYSQYKLHTLTIDELRVDIPKEKQPHTGEEILRALGRHVVLPQGVPQIAVVQDVAKLKTSQAFFENAENEDIVIVYDSVIFLYRPSQDIVVSSGEINGFGK